LGFGRDTVEGGIEIPLPLFNRNQAKIAGAGIRIRQADFRIGQVRNEILAELSRIFADYTAAREAALQYEKEILPSVIMAYRQTREGYTNRKFSYLDVLDAQGTLVETRSAHLVALRDLAWAAADLERLTGGKTTSR
jgi:cobalt-zinc-cadmium efflux system outer membrane protein